MARCVAGGQISKKIVVAPVADARPLIRRDVEGVPADRDRAGEFPAIVGQFFLLQSHSGRFAANEMQAVVAAAIAGYGIAQLPYQVAEASVRDGRLRRVLGDYTTPVGGLYAVYPSSRHVSPLVKAFIELAAERLAATGTSEDDKA